MPSTQTQTATRGTITFLEALTRVFEQQASTALGEPDLNNLACGDDDRAYELYEQARDGRMCELATAKVAAMYPGATDLEYEFEALPELSGRRITATFTFEA